MVRVLVLDGQQRSALAVVRSLGRNGVQVFVADTQVPSLAGVSRYAHSQLQYPNPQSSPSNFVTWVHETVRELNIDHVFPASDITTMLLAADRNWECRNRVLCAPADAYERVTDKHRLLETARRSGVLAPSSVTANSLQEVEQNLRTAKFPLVLKPARSRVLIGDKIIATSVCIAKSLPEALAYARAQHWIGIIPCLLQEYVEGCGAGIFAFYWNGKPVAWFAHRRIREKPPQGGISVLSVSEPVDSRLRDAAERLLNEAKWNGVAMVEFRVSPGGVPYLMEVNGRLWGSLQLAIDSGVDFPWLIFSAANGAALHARRNYAVGCRLRWFLGDVDCLLLELRGKGAARTLPQRAHACLNFVRTTFDKATRNEIVRLDDLRPGWFELRSWFKFTA